MWHSASAEMYCSIFPFIDTHPTCHRYEWILMTVGKTRLAQLFCLVYLIQSAPVICIRNMCWEYVLPFSFSPVHSFLNSFKTLSVIGVATCRRCWRRSLFFFVSTMWRAKLSPTRLGWLCGSAEAAMCHAGCWLRGKTLQKMKVCWRGFLSTSVWRGSQGLCGSPAGQQISLAQECLLQVSRVPVEGCEVAVMREGGPWDGKQWRTSGETLGCRQLWHNWNSAAGSRR